jgi:uncharacterized Zn finger protein
MPDKKNEEKERLNKMKQLLMDVKSGKEAKISSAIKGLKVHGDQSVLAPLIDVWNKGISEKNEEELISFLNNLRFNESVYPIIDILRDSAYHKIHTPLLSTIWNSQIDYSEYLVDFVSMAVKGDFLMALECLTIIENLEGPFEEQQFFEAQIELSEYASKQNKDAKKEQIMSEIALLIKDFERKHIDL